MPYENLAQCHADINAKFADNDERLITEGTARQVLNDMADFLHDTFNLIDITYQDFRNAMLQENEFTPLIPGRYYRIVDNRTCHLIYEISAFGGLVYTGEEQLGPIEPLIVFATGEASYADSQVISQPTGHRLTWRYNGAMIGYDVGSVYTGIITQRTIDKMRVSIPYDFMSVVWKMNGQYYTAFGGSFDDPAEINFLNDRTSESQNVVVKTLLYNNFRPIIFTLPDTPIINVEIDVVEMMVCRYLNRVNLQDISCCNVNCNFLNINGSRISTVSDIVELALITVQNTFINNRLIISDISDGPRWSNCMVVNNDTTAGVISGIRIINGVLTIITPTS